VLKFRVRSAEEWAVEQLPLELPRAKEHCDIDIVFPISSSAEVFHGCDKHNRFRALAT
jgi:hypothetical protein